MGRRGVGRRGDELSEHILFAAKDVFLELGFERASMDVIAERAKTSKRTLYAHFESKEKLYLAVIDLIRGLYLGKLRSPADYAEDTSEALVQFCGRFMELRLWTAAIRMYRLAISEAERFPEGSASFYDAIFTTAHERLAGFLRERLKLGPKASAEAADDLIGRIMHPRLTRAVFGIDKVRADLPEDDMVSADFDLKPIRKAVAMLLNQRSS
jgi:AcrR family transcriptional regulator